uniref:G-protein coupled receptors family 1 profile domain-containing protein n=1 Tax=Plectus sambesii TaxID=2011161 RepID=A0A914X4S6_9BILA
MEELKSSDECPLAATTTHWFFIFHTLSCNDSNVTIPHFMLKTPYVVLMTVIASTIIFGTIISNALFICTLARMKRSSTSTKTVYFSLAMGNLILGHVCLFFIPSVAAHSEWPFADWLCQTTAYLAASLLLITAFSMTGLSVKRCIIICRPLDFHRFVGRRASTIAMTLIWIS